MTRATAPEYEVVVVGAGMVGAAIAYGLAGLNRRVLMLDGADMDFRAAKANFGLVWAHGKGDGFPAYQRLSLEAVRAWAQFAQQLEAESGIDLVYDGRGGLHFCLGDEELCARAAAMAKWQAQTPDLEATTQILDRVELRRRFPALRLGKDVAGASLGQLDGQVNPLRLLTALQTAYLRRGGQLQTNKPVTAINALRGGGLEVVAGADRVRAEQVVIAAGLGSSALARSVEIDVPLRPQRGQLLVTERLEPLLPIACSGLRQTGEGTVMIGVTQEEVGYDMATTTEGAVRMARKALRILPELARAKLVRQWACLRVMTPDGLPVYASSTTHPGVHVATCHSGVTLASFHAGAIAGGLAGGQLPCSANVFHPDRFHVQKAA